MTEKDIQNYIWENRKNFKDMLQPAEFPEIEDKDPWQYTPTDILYNTAIDKYKKMWKAIQEMEFLGSEIPLEKKEDSTIRTDFLGTFVGENGIVVIELKKSRQTERQAYTELLGYGNHIRKLFAPMCKSDIFYLLIAPMEERIVRDATIHTLLYDKNNVCALIPSWEKEDVKTLKFKLWIPSLKEFAKLSLGTFTELNFDVCKIAWDGIPGVWSPDKEGEEPDKYIIKRLNHVSQYAAQLMESRGIHGFVYCSQLYPDIPKSMFPLRNGIIICGINPYKAVKNRLLISKGKSMEIADQTNIEDVKIYDVIKGLKSELFNENDETLYDLSDSWSNDIEEIAIKTVDTLTMSLSRDSIEIDWCDFNWESFQKSFSEDMNCYNYNITLTGILRELFFEYSKLDWNYIKKYGYDYHPIYMDGDMPNDLIDIIHSQYYVRAFIKRLEDPYYKLKEYI